MLLTSHLAASVLVGNAFITNNGEWAVALLGGVLVDADHFFVNKKWIDDVKIFVKEKKIVRGINQHSWFQEWLFGLFSASLLGLFINFIFPQIRWWVLPVFLCIHIAMDSIMVCEHKPFVPFSTWSYWGFLKSGTIIEFVVSIAILFWIFIS